MTPDQHSTPSAERQALRSRFGLRLIAPEEQGSPFQRLPNGVYGFSSSASTAELPMFSQPAHGAFEVHKMPGGEAAWVGYVREPEFRQFQAGTGPFTLEIYPEPYGDATHMIAVPAGRIARRNPQSRENGMPMRVEVTPATE